jgi:carboxypeptidase C (cathepsin A)
MIAMRKSDSFAPFALALLLTLGSAMHDDDDKDADAKAQSDKDSKKDVQPIPPERSVVTKHSVRIGGRTINYKATAGTLLIKDDKDKPTVSFFYVAYTVDDGKPGKRPVTFMYNGGPGSSSMWLHMGSFGPVRVANRATSRFRHRHMRP